MDVCASCVYPQIPEEGVGFPWTKYLWSAMHMLGIKLGSSGGKKPVFLSHFSSHSFVILKGVCPLFQITDS